MRKSLRLTLVLISIFGSCYAQNTMPTGSWLLTRVEVGGEVHHPHFISNFKENGAMFVSGVEAGTWEYKKNSKTLILNSEFSKELNGKGRVFSLSEQELVLEKDGAKLFYQKINITEIAAGNKLSGLLGTWVFQDAPHPDVRMIVTFKAPDVFTIIEKGEAYEARSRGTWIFQDQDMSLVMIGLRGEDLFQGENRLLIIEEDKLRMENKGRIFEGKRMVHHAAKIERLSFSERDFYTEDGDYKYEADEANLPWRSWSEMKTGLLEVRQLVYNYSTLIRGSEVFESKKLVADVHATLEEEGFVIDNIFHGYDRYTLPEDAELYQDADYAEPLYPLGGDTYRIIGVEQVTTAAGAFECTVLEAIAPSGLLRKLWMINDQIGTYAKIIEEDPDESFGHYRLYELNEIMLQ